MYIVWIASVAQKSIIRKNGDMLDRLSWLQLKLCRFSVMDIICRNKLVRKLTENKRWLAN